VARDELCGDDEGNITDGMLEIRQYPELFNLALMAGVPRLAA
jgi:hypothetical protein